MTFDDQNEQAPCVPGDDTITINGINFDNGHTPVVVLGDYGELGVCGHSANTIVARCPPDPEQAGLGTCYDGDYRLGVFTRRGKQGDDEHDLTVGAVGPQGERGPQGPQGPQGPPASDVYAGKECPDGQKFIGFQADGSLKCRCDPVTSDCDGDGYTLGDGDCGPLDKFAYPQSGYWAGEPRKDGSWDWNCDGKVSKMIPNLVKKGTWPKPCEEGWKNSVPPCGGSGTRVAVESCGPLGLGCCVDFEDFIGQGCR